MLNSTAAVPPIPAAPVMSAERSLIDVKQSDTISGRAWTAAAVLCLLLAILYSHVAVKLVSDWYNIADNSHGLLIPFFVLFLIWDKRELLLNTPLRPSWS